MKPVLCMLMAAVLLLLACQKDVSDNQQTQVQLTVDKTSFTFSGEAPGLDSFYIQSDTAWIITVLPSNAAWLNVSTANGSGNGRITINIVEDNLSDTVRKATIIISAVNDPSVNATISVSQLSRVLVNAFGGTASEAFNDVVRTSDKGFIAIGYASSLNGDVSGVHGPTWEDVWLIRYDSQYNIVWKRVLGGSQRDMGLHIIRATGFGYVFCTSAGSIDGYMAGHDPEDAFFARVDDAGNPLWRRSYGGSGKDVCLDIRQATDGGYFMFGFSTSNDSEVGPNKGMGDGWIVKLDVNGNKQWQKTLGGSWADQFYSGIATPDGGCIAIGETQSTDGDITGSHGNMETWAVKLDADGNVQWNKVYGGSGGEDGWSIAPAVDGGYVLAGNTTSNNGDISGNHGAMDALVIKIDDNGAIQWQRCFGGLGNDRLRRIIRTTDNKYLLCGQTWSAELHTNFKGQGDGWVFTIDAGGNMVSQKVLGGSDQEFANSVLDLGNGNYVLAGITFSNDKDIIGHHGYSDAWFMRFRF